MRTPIGRIEVRRRGTRYRLGPGSTLRGVEHADRPIGTVDRIGLGRIRLELACEIPPGVEARPLDFGTAYQLEPIPENPRALLVSRVFLGKPRDGSFEFELLDGPELERR